ncbi:MAG: DNA methyltransferase [Akkermansia sp.]
MPFCGSGTTGIAASLLGRRFLGIDKEISFMEMAKLRREELNDDGRRKEYSRKIRDLSKLS